MGDLSDPLLAQLDAVAGLVAVLELALEEDDVGEGMSAANQLVTATTSLLEETLRDPLADVELTSALKVFRNAAFAYRGLGRASEENAAAMAAACSMMIQQGHDHFGRFTHGRGENLP